MARKVLAIHTGVGDVLPDLYAELSEASDRERTGDLSETGLTISDAIDRTGTDRLRESDLTIANAMYLAGWEVVEFDSLKQDRADLMREVIGKPITRFELMAHAGPFRFTDQTPGQLSMKFFKLLDQRGSGLNLNTKVYLTGCNTGVDEPRGWDDPTTRAFRCISDYLSAATCLPVFGTKGYVNAVSLGMHELRELTRTPKQYTISCEPFDWGGSMESGTEQDTEPYGGTSSETGSDVFRQFLSCDELGPAIFANDIIEEKELDREIVADLLSLTRQFKPPIPRDYRLEAPFVSVRLAKPRRTLEMFLGGRRLRDTRSGHEAAVPSDLFKQLIAYGMPQVAPEAYPLVVGPKGPISFEATAPDFGDLIRVRAKTAEEAIGLAREEIMEVTASLRKEGKRVPRPGSVKKGA